MVIVSVNGAPLPAAAADAGGRGRGLRGGPSPLDALPAGRVATVEVTAHGADLTLTLTPEAPHATDCKLVDVPTATAAQKQLRAGWLAGH
jgi:hypothetical protein